MLLADATAKYADGLYGLHAGSLDESLAAARMAAASADITDIRGLIAERQPSVQAAHDGHNSAVQAVATAEHAHRQEELQMTGSALDDQIRRVETTLCAALAERYQIFLKVNGPTPRQRSLFNVWQVRQIGVRITQVHIQPFYRC